MKALDWRAAHQQWSEKKVGRNGPAFVEIVGHEGSNPIIITPAHNNEVQHLLEAMGVSRKLAKTQAHALVMSAVEARDRDEKPGATLFNARGEEILLAPIMDEWDHVAERSIVAPQGYGLTSPEQYDAAWIEHFELTDFKIALQQDTIRPDSFGHGL